MIYWFWLAPERKVNEKLLWWRNESFERQLPKDFHSEGPKRPWGLFKLPFWSKRHIICIGYVNRELVKPFSRRLYEYCFHVLLGKIRDCIKPEKIIKILNVYYTIQELFQSSERYRAQM